MRSDEEIRAKVLDRLAREPSVAAGEIAIDVSEGVVELTGHVASYAALTDAVKAVYRVPGVRAVSAGLEVELPPAAVRSDAELRRAASVALEWNVMLLSKRISVAVENGWVELRGEVDWPYQRDAAEQAVAQLVGVRGIVNRIGAMQPLSADCTEPPAPHFLAVPRRP